VSEFFIYEGASAPGASGLRERYVLLFAPHNEFHPEQAEDALVRFLRTVRAPDRLFFLSFERNRSALIEFSLRRQLRERLPLGAGNLAERVMCLFFDSAGCLRDGAGKETDPVLLQFLRNDGIRTIFNSRGGMVQARSSIHFVKPSGDHVDRFIRAANVLQQGPEITFIAAWILPYLKEDTVAIYCDTATISCLAFCLIALKQSLDPGIRIPLRVHSFGSYAGLTTAGPPPTRSLVLISASTTGRLPQQLTDHQLDSKSMVTLFRLQAINGPKIAAHGYTLCDLDWEPERIPKGHLPIKNEHAGTCAFCQTERRSRIPISPDTFIPEQAQEKFHVLTKPHRPKEVEAYLEHTVGTGVTRCHVRPIANPAFDYEISLDAAKLLAPGGALETALMNLIERNCPRTVIHLEDEASVAVATRLCELIVAEGRPAAVMLSNRVALQQPQGMPTAVAPILIVTSALVGGRRLNDLSRHVRGFAGSVEYFGVIGRAISRAIYKEVKGNLVYRADGTKNGFSTFLDIFLPRPEFRISPWTSEQRFLRKLKKQGPLEPFLAARLRLLEDGRESVDSDPGLTNRLFWPALDGKTLELRENFAFYDGDKPCSLFSQADVYLVAVSILHDLRMADTPLQLLSPGNFDRFNDGIIQAALLRAANPAELNFTLQDFHSDYMRDLICFMLAEPGHVHSEALPEFLFAWATGHLRLTLKDHRSVSDEVTRCAALPGYLKRICQQASHPDARAEAFAQSGALSG
jgi:hypothetical protein